jgi:hypothetical protein
MRRVAGVQLIENTIVSNRSFCHSYSSIVRKPYVDSVAELATDDLPSGDREQDNAGELDDEFFGGVEPVEHTNLPPA